MIYLLKPRIKVRIKQFIAQSNNRDFDIFEGERTKKSFHFRTRLFRFFPRFDTHQLISLHLLPQPRKSRRVFTLRRVATTKPRLKRLNSTTIYGHKLSLSVTSGNVINHYGFCCVAWQCSSEPFFGTQCCQIEGFFSPMRGMGEFCSGLGGTGVFEVTFSIARLWLVDSSIQF